jgi:hypothetical protein
MSSSELGNRDARDHRRDCRPGGHRAARAVGTLGAEAITALTGFLNGGSGSHVEVMRKLANVTHSASSLKPSGRSRPER